MGVLIAKKSRKRVCIIDPTVAHFFTSRVFLGINRRGGEPNQETRSIREGGSDARGTIRSA